MFFSSLQTRHLNCHVPLLWNTGSYHALVFCGMKKSTYIKCNPHSCRTSEGRSGHPWGNWRVSSDILQLLSTCQKNTDKMVQVLRMWCPPMSSKYFTPSRTCSWINIHFNQPATIVVFALGRRLRLQQHSYHPAIFHWTQMLLQDQQKMIQEHILLGKTMVTHEQT